MPYCPCSNVLARDDRILVAQDGFDHPGGSQRDGEVRGPLEPDDVVGRVLYGLEYCLKVPAACIRPRTPRNWA